MCTLIIKQKLLYFIFCIPLLFNFQLIHAGTLHSVVGVVQYTDGSHPNSLNFNAYVTSRPTEVLTQNSAGSGYDPSTGQYLLQCASFPTAWSAGDVVHIDFNDSNGAVGSDEISLTNNAYDDAGTTTLSPQTAPEIDVGDFNTMTSITDGDASPSPSDGTDFGNADVDGETVSNIFYIQNKGDADLNLTGTPMVAITGTNASDFTITMQPQSSVISPSTLDLFTVEFDPRNSGLRTATIRIANNDADENPYNFAIQGTGVTTYQLTVSVMPSGSGTVSKSPDKTNFTWNESVQLKAQANTGYEFDYWSGDLTGSTNPKSLTMDGNKSVTAHFKQIQESVTAPNRPSGPSSGKVGQSLDFSTGGASSNLGHSVEYKFDWGDGTTSSWGLASRSHSYSSSGTFDVKAKARCTSHTSKVSSWSSSKSVSISFCQLTVSVMPSGSGSVSISPDKNNYAWNESVQLTANPNSGWEFDYWSGALSGSTNPKSLTMNGDKTVTAYFRQNEETVSTPTTPTGPSSGKVGQSLDYSTGGASSNLGHAIEYKFDWGDGTTSSWGSASRSHSYNPSGTYDVKVRARCSSHTSKVSSWSSSKSVTVSYSQLSISIRPSGSGSVSKNPNKSNFTWNESVQLTASANSGYEFDYWSGALSGSTNPKSLTMNGDKSVTAHFKVEPEVVSTPNRPSGASSGKVDQSLDFSTGGSSSNLGHAIEYKFDWGDGSKSSWGSANRSHSYASSGSFNVKAKARCTSHTSKVSSWSPSKSVSITYCQLSVSVTPSGSGSVSKSPDKNNFTWNETVQLTAQANSGYEFDYWSGALSGSTNPKSLTMNGDKSVTAHFKVEPEFVSTPNRPSGPSNGKVGQSLDFSTGGSSSNFGHAIEYKFDWGDGSTSSWGSANRSHSYSSSGTFKVKARARCTSHTSVVSSWSFQKSVSISYCQLSISVTPSGSGSVSKSPNKNNFTWNETVQLTAHANSGYEFDYWSGALSGSTNPKSLTMNGDKSVTVHFKVEPEVVSAANRPSGAASGKVGQSLDFSTGGASSNLGHSIEYRFDWGDGTTSSWGSANRSHSYASSGSFNVKAKARCTSHTSKVSSWSPSKSVSISYCQLSVSVTPSGSGSVSKSPNKSNFTWNETVQLTAQANSGFEFDYWSGALTGGTNPKSLTMNGDNNVIAFFKVSSQNSAPLRPTLVSLTDNSYTNKPDPKLTWMTPLDTDGDSLHFKVEIARDSSFSNEIIGSPFESQINATGFDPTPPLVQGSGSFVLFGQLSDGDYWWRVTAWDGKAYGQPSEVWKFTIDTAKPYTSGHTPGKDATDVPVNTNIVVHIKDDLSGVDTSTIVMKVNLTKVSPTITGGARDVTLTYVPPDSFEYDSRVTISVGAKDVAGNEMDTDYYSFFTEKKAQKLAFLTLTVQEHGLSEPFSVDINIEQVNGLFGVSFVFNYPDNYLEYISFEPGDFMGQDVIPFTSPPSNGQLPAAITKKAGQAGSNGSGLVARIKLKEKSGVATGTNITLFCTEISAVDPVGNDISLTPRDTSYVTPFPTSVEMKDTQISENYTLYQNYPNPFNPTTTIAFALPKPSQVCLQIFNLKGKLVKTLIDAQQEQGMHSVQWNGTDEKRNKVASGIYIYKLTAGDEVLHRRLVLMK